MKGIIYQLKSVRRDKMCIMSFLMPVVFALLLTLMGGIDISPLEEMHFGIAKSNISDEDKNWLEQLGKVHVYSNMDDMENAVLDPATNVIGVQKSQDGIETVMAGDEMEVFKDVADTLPSLYLQKDESVSVETEILAKPSFIDNYKYMFIVAILIVAMFMGCVFNAMNIISEKEDGIIYINEVMPITHTQYAFQKIFIGFLFGCLSAILTACVSLALPINMAGALFVLILLSAFISSLIGMFIGMAANGILIGITYIKIVMLLFIAVPLFSYLLGLGESFIGKICYIIPSTSTFEGIMGLINGDMPIAIKSIIIMFIHCICWFAIYVFTEFYKKRVSSR